MTEQTVIDILNLLDLEEIEQNHYLASSPSDGWQRVYGGQVIGQALVAAAKTVPEDRLAHSLHGYFLRAGDTTVPILYKVERIRDGKSFNTRSVLAIQHGQAIFSMSLSFQVQEDGLSHQEPMPDVPAPEDLRDEREWREQFAKMLPAEHQEQFLRERPIEFRPTEPWDPSKSTPRPPRQLAWMKIKDRLPDSPALHQCALAYLSDWSLLDTGTLPHALNWMDSNVQMASLDHSLWFHRPFRADDWLLYAQDSPSASGSRGFNRGMIFNQQGQLVASAAQEGLMRVHDKKG